MNKTCKYKMSLSKCRKFKKPDLCGAYAESKRKDKLFWAHFPECKDEKCPLLHPGLLGNATL